MSCEGDEGSTGSHVSKQQFIGMSSLLQGLPDMVMCVDEPWTDDLAGAVNDLSFRGRLDIGSYLRNGVSLDQKVCFHRLHMAILVVDEKCSSLEEN